jgi:hypothetical protein
VGAIYRAGFDSIYVLQYMNDLPIARMSQPLIYDTGRSHFAFAPRIHAEMSEYRFEVHLVAGTFDSTIALRDSIACGDALLMDGQSNAFNGFIVDTFQTEFSRTFGLRGSQNLRDTFWLKSNGGVGAADERIQEDLVNFTSMPSFSVNDALGGTAIEAHFWNDSDKYDLRTIYGRMLYRTTISGMLGAVKVFYGYRVKRIPPMAITKNSSNSLIVGKRITQIYKRFTCFKCAQTIVIGEISPCEMCSAPWGIPSQV